MLLSRYRNQYDDAPFTMPALLDYRENCCSDVRGKVNRFSNPANACESGVSSSCCICIRHTAICAARTAAVESHEPSASGASKFLALQ
eukprot:IDg19177t1